MASDFEVQKLVQSYKRVLSSRERKNKPLSENYATFGAWVALRAKSFHGASADEMGELSHKIDGEYSAVELNALFDKFKDQDSTHIIGDDVLQALYGRDNTGISLLADEYLRVFHSEKSTTKSFSEWMIDAALNSRTWTHKVSIRVLRSMPTGAIEDWYGNYRG